MKNKGFTLFEVIGTVVLLGFIALLVTPTIIRILREQRSNAYDRQIEQIENAARNWGAINYQILGEGTYMCSITRLKADGFIEDDVIQNPNNPKKQITGCVEIKYNVSQNKYIYTFKEVATTQIATQCKCEGV